MGLPNDVIAAWVLALVCPAVLFVATLFLPPVQFSQGVPAAAGEQLIEAEMTNLNPDDEPVAINE